MMLVVMVTSTSFSTPSINNTYGADASVPVAVYIYVYVTLNKLHSMHISNYMQVLDKQSEE